jgi:hypothetical protein
MGDPVDTGFGFLVDAEFIDLSIHSLHLLVVTEWVHGVVFFTTLQMLPMVD